MADMMQGAPPRGAPRNPMAGNDPMSKNRTALNPADMAFMQGSGQMRPDMTWSEFWENGFGITPDMTLQEAMPKLKKNVENASPEGKMQNIAAEGGGPSDQRNPMPQGRKPMVQSGGLEGLMGQIGQ